MTVQIPRWRRSAACRDMDVSVFMPNVAGAVTQPWAVETCRTCPVADECLAMALADPLLYLDGTGIYAGLTPKQRRSIRPQREVA